MKRTPYVATIFAVLALGACSQATSPSPSSEKYTRFPGKCFDGYESSLAQVAGPLYKQRRHNPFSDDQSASHAVGLGKCGAVFATGRSVQGVPLRSIVVTVSYTLFTSGSTNNPEGLIADSFRSALQKDSAPKYPFVAGEEARFWYRPAGELPGAQAAIRDDNLLITVRVRATMLGTGNTERPGPARQDEAAAMSIAKAALAAMPH